VGAENKLCNCGEVGTAVPKKRSGSWGGRGEKLAQTTKASGINAFFKGNSAALFDAKKKGKKGRGQEEKEPFATEKQHD